MPTLISRPAPELDRARLPGGTASRRARVLVLDGQTTQALACVRSLGRAGYDVLVASDCRWPLGAWSRHSRARFRVKGETVAAFAELRAWARRLGVSVVLPLTERSCLLCDAERAAWTEVGITVGCAPTDVLVQAFDKGRVIARAEACGVSVPPTQFPDSLAACHAAAEVVGFPCVVKARRSNVPTEMGFSRDPGPGYAASHAELGQQPAPFRPDGSQAASARRAVARRARVARAGDGGIPRRRRAPSLAHRGERPVLGVARARDRRRRRLPAALDADARGRDRDRGARLSGRRGRAVALGRREALPPYPPRPAAGL